MAQNLIYGLIDPRTGQLRYVGKSTCGLARPRQHKKPSELKSRNRKTNWIKSVLASGNCYEIVILEELSPEVLDAEINEAEVFWIGCLKMIGCNLTNGTLGGDGNRGYRASAETKRLQRAAKLGKPIGTEHAAKLKAGHRAFMEKNQDKLAAIHGSFRFVDQHGNLYDTVRGAARRLNLKHQNISAVLKGRARTTGGYIFKYLKEG